MSGETEKAAAGVEVSDGSTRYCDHMKVIFDNEPRAIKNGLRC